MIDLHSHILPGVDDGVASLDEATLLARVAADNDIATIVATPHRSPWAYTAARSDAERRLDAVRGACRSAGIEITLVLGSEAYIAPDLAEQVQRGLALTINAGRYLLVEWPIDQYPRYSEEAVFRLQLQGIIPIIAHAERYRFVQDDLARLVGYVARGALVQVTAASLLGQAGAAAQKAAETLLTRGLAQIIASDSHGAERRPPILGPARDRAAALIGDRRAQAMVQTAPAQIIANQPVELPPPERRPARPFWAFWRERK